MQYWPMGIPVEISGRSCVLLAVLCVLLPWDWLLAALSAAFFHELCHIVTVFAVGGKIQRVHIGASGAVLTAMPMHPWKELICTLAGPMGSLLLLLLARWIPQVAFCGLAQGLYNLIPIASLDGGRILSCVTQLLFSETASEKICAVVQKTFLCLALLIGLLGTFSFKLGLMPLLMAVDLLSRGLQGKIPCKEGNLAVQ